MSAISAAGNTSCVIDEPMTWKGFAIRTVILLIIFVFISAIPGATLILLLDWICR